MRRLLRFLLLKPVLWAANRFSSRPDRRRIFEALDKLYQRILEKPGNRGIVIPFSAEQAKFIIFSDQHKGARNGADDFQLAEPNYLAALDFYAREDFIFISLGDNEELWENSLSSVKKFNQANFEAEKKFLAHNRFVKIFGNHDLYWDNDPLAGFQLKQIFGERIPVYEGVILATQVGEQPLHIFCTHGHQGDAQSDGNWFSKFFVAKIWAPLQAYLRINPNTPAYNGVKKTLHNEIMYEWSSGRSKQLLITGHTHQPVFGSLTHLERLYKRYQQAERAGDEATLATIRTEIRQQQHNFVAVAVNYMNMKPSYFNSGCCCFNDGDITGIEIDNGWMRLVKWTQAAAGSTREILEEATLSQLLNECNQ